MTTESSSSPSVSAPTSSSPSTSAVPLTTTTTTSSSNTPLTTTSFPPNSNKAPVPVWRLVSEKSALRGYLNVLGVTPEATLSDIRNAYKKLSLQWHPDRNDAPNARLKFQEISEAYTALCVEEGDAQEIDVALYEKASLPDTKNIYPVGLAGVTPGLAGVFPPPTTQHEIFQTQHVSPLFGQLGTFQQSLLHVSHLHQNNSTTTNGITHEAPTSLNNLLSSPNYAHKLTTPKLSPSVDNVMSMTMNGHNKFMTHVCAHRQASPNSAVTCDCSVLINNAANLHPKQITQAKSNKPTHATPSVISSSSSSSSSALATNNTTNAHIAPVPAESIVGCAQVGLPTYEPQDSSIKVQWTAVRHPTFPLFYQLFIKIKKAYQLVYQGTDTSYLVPNLLPGTKYSFRVRACKASSLLVGLNIDDEEEEQEVVDVTVEQDQSGLGNFSQSVAVNTLGNKLEDSAVHPPVLSNLQLAAMKKKDKKKKKANVNGKKEATDKELSDILAEVTEESPKKVPADEKKKSGKTKENEKANTNKPLSKKEEKELKRKQEEEKRKQAQEEAARKKREEEEAYERFIEEKRRELDENRMREEALALERFAALKAEQDRKKAAEDSKPSTTVASGENGSNKVSPTKAKAKPSLPEAAPLMHIRLKQPGNATTSTSTTSTTANVSATPISNTSSSTVVNTSSVASVTASASVTQSTQPSTTQGSKPSAWNIPKVSPVVTTSQNAVASSPSGSESTNSGNVIPPAGQTASASAPVSTAVSAASSPVVSAKVGNSAAVGTVNIPAPIITNKSKGGRAWTTPTVPTTPNNNTSSGSASPIPNLVSTTPVASTTPSSSTNGTVTSSTATASPNPVSIIRKVPGQQKAWATPPTPSPKLSSAAAPFVPYAERMQLQKQPGQPSRLLNSSKKPSARTSQGYGHDSHSPASLSQHQTVMSSSVSSSSSLHSSSSSNSLSSFDTAIEDDLSEISKEIERERWNSHSHHHVHHEPSLSQQSSSYDSPWEPATPTSSASTVSHSSFNSSLPISIPSANTHLIHGFSSLSLRPSLIEDDIPSLSAPSPKYWEDPVYVPQGADRSRSSSVSSASSTSSVGSFVNVPPPLVADFGASPFTSGVNTGMSSVASLSPRDSNSLSSAFIPLSSSNNGSASNAPNATNPNSSGILGMNPLFNNFGLPSFSSFGSAFAAPTLSNNNWGTLPTLDSTSSYASHDHDSHTTDDMSQSHYIHDDSDEHHHHHSHTSLVDDVLNSPTHDEPPSLSDPSQNFNLAFQSDVQATQPSIRLGWPDPWQN